MQDSPASRNLCALDDAEQEAWEDAQALSDQQRRCRARAIVAREQEEVSVASLDPYGGTSASLVCTCGCNSLEALPSQVFFSL